MVEIVGKVVVALAIERAGTTVEVETLASFPL